MMAYHNECPAPIGPSKARPASACPAQRESNVRNKRPWGAENVMPQAIPAVHSPYHSW